MMCCRSKLLPITVIGYTFRLYLRQAHLGLAILNSRSVLLAAFYSIDLAPDVVFISL
jgi:hypothetical protein